MGQSRKRRKWKAEEKLRIVLLGMQPGVDVSDVCRREGINPTLYYTWKKKLLSSAVKIFEEKGTPSGVEAERAQSALTRMKGVVAEITAENLDLKKTLSG